MKKILALLVSVTLVSVSIIPAPVAHAKALAIKMQNVEHANNDYAELLNDFSDFNYQTVSEIQYPDYYSGSYINAAGNLVIKVTNDSPEIINTLKTITSNDSIIVQKSDVSYNTLNSLLLEINDSIIRNGELLNARLGIFTCAIIDQESCIAVYLDNPSPENIIYFKGNVVDSEYLDFRAKPSENSIQNEIVPYATASVSAGQLVSNDTQSSLCTASFRAKDSNCVRFKCSINPNKSSKKCRYTRIFSWWNDRE